MDAFCLVMIYDKATGERLEPWAQSAEEPYPASDTTRPYCLEDVLYSFLLAHPGAPWQATVEVIGGCLHCKFGAYDAVWLLAPDDLATAPAVIAEVITSCRAEQERPS